MITRREFGKYMSTGALALGIGEVSMGFSCNAGTVFTDITNYVPIALAAFNEVITLINPAEATALAPIIGDVKTAFADLQAAVVAYENAPAAQKATLVCKIATAIQVVEQQIQTFWSSLNLPDASLAAVIAGVLQIVLSTLMAFIPALNCSTSPTLAAKHFKKVIKYVPKKRSVSQFKKDINAELVQGHYAPIFK